VTDFEVEPRAALSHQLNHHHHHHTSASSSSLKPTTAIDIASKLDLVADYENLSDAAFALSEWISKAAGVEEIHAFCQSRSFATVIKRAITEPYDPIKYTDSILPSMLHMIGTLFLLVRMSSRAVSSTRKSLETVIQEARAVAQYDPVFAEKVALYIISRIGKAVEELKDCYSDDDGVGLILRLEDEVESLSSSIATSREACGGVIDLITKRDTNKTAAEKASAVVGVAMGTSFRGNITTVTEVTSDREDILIDLIGPKEAAARTAFREKHQELKSKLSSVITQNEEKRSRMESQLVGLQAQRSMVADRMEQLRQALRRLEEDDEELCEKITDVKDQIQDHYKSSNDQVGELHCETVNMERHIGNEASLDGLVDRLKVYEESLKKAVAVSNLFENCDNVNDFVSSKLGVYFVHVGNYFASEAECVEFLRKRVTNLEKESRDLVLEIAECKELQMTATVSQLSDALSLNQQNISDDSTVMEGLLCEAQSMMSGLIGRLEQFVTREDITELTQIHVTLLRGIVGTAELMGLDEVDKLKTFLPSNADDMPIVVTTSHDEHDSDFDLATDDDTCDEIDVVKSCHEEEEDAVIMVERDMQEATDPVLDASFCGEDIRRRDDKEDEVDVSRINEGAKPREESSQLDVERKSNGKQLSWANVVRVKNGTVK